MKKVDHSFSTKIYERKYLFIFLNLMIIIIISRMFPVKSKKVNPKFGYHHFSWSKHVILVLKISFEPRHVKTKLKILLTMNAHTRPRICTISREPYLIPSIINRPSKILDKERKTWTQGMAANACLSDTGAQLH